MPPFKCTPYIHRTNSCILIAGRNLKMKSQYYLILTKKKIKQVIVFTSLNFHLKTIHLQKIFHFLLTAECNVQLSSHGPMSVRRPWNHMTVVSTFPCKSQTKISALKLLGSLKFKLAKIQQFFTGFLRKELSSLANT